MLRFRIRDGGRVLNFIARKGAIWKATILEENLRGQNKRLTYPLSRTDSRETDWGVRLCNGMRRSLARGQSTKLDGWLDARKRERRGGEREQEFRRPDSSGSSSFRKIKRDKTEKDDDCIFKITSRSQQQGEALLYNFLVDSKAVISFSSYVNPGPRFHRRLTLVSSMGLS